MRNIPDSWKKKQLPDSNNTEVNRESDKIEEEKSQSNIAAEADSTSEKERSKKSVRADRNNKERGDTYTEKNTPVSIGKILLIILFVLILLAAAILAIKLFWGNKEETSSHETIVEETTISASESETTVERTVESSTDSSSQPSSSETTEPTNLGLNVNDYVGYWHMENIYDAELEIDDISNNKVDMRYWCYPLSPMKITANLEGSVAQFSYNQDGISFAGFLTFNPSTIVLDITESNNTYISVFTYSFKERGQQSWVSFYEPPYTSPPETTASSLSNDFIFPDSNSRYLDRAEVEVLSLDQLRIARNEIYARLGRTFRDQDLQNYFNSKSWYIGWYSPEEFDALGESILNEYEIANSNLIAEVEAEKQSQ